MKPDMDNQTVYFKESLTPEATPFDSLLLLVFDEAKAPYQVDLTQFRKSVISFGRDGRNDLTLQSAFVSRTHGAFYIQDNQVFIRDDNSRNGLYWNDRFVKVHALKDGDRIRIDDGADRGEGGVLILCFDKNRQQAWHKCFVQDTDLRIGRSKNSDIVLNHVSVSQSHAIISRQRNSFWITDRQSTNGTYVNGKRVQDKTRLYEKDIISITNSMIVFSSHYIYYTTINQGIRIQAESISKVVSEGIGKTKRILSNVTLEIPPGEFIAIVGGSGTGKSTVMNCLNGYSEPTQGAVYYNSLNLYDNFNALKHIIGYVPQADIVYDNLTVYEMLMYSAKLRLPSDTSQEERRSIVEKAIDNVELTEHAHTPIGKLSGGQKKRASIAVELLSDPPVFFLDEPASGLDPATEYNLVSTLKKMTGSGITVIIVTHSTLNLHLCDRILFMGKDGVLSFFGSLKEAYQFYQVDPESEKAIVEIYQKIPLTLAAKSTPSQDTLRHHPNRQSIGALPSKGNRQTTSMIKQLLTLSSRYLRLMFKDVSKLAVLIGLAPLIGFLISLAANGKQFEQFEITKSLLFVLSCSAFFIGTLNAISEICKERAIFQREYMAGLSVISYIGSKFLVLGLISLIQSALLVLTFTTLVGVPEEGVRWWPYIEIYVTTFLTQMSATGIGLLVSALVSKPDQANTLAPILLIPQILFSGLVFALDGVTEFISYFAVCRWSIEGFGTTANLNELPLRLQTEGFPIPRVADEMFTFTWDHLLTSWGILLAFVILTAIGATIVVAFRASDN